MASRLLLGLMFFVFAADVAEAQRGFRRGFYGPRGGRAERGYQQPPQMPYYPPYQPYYGGQFAPVQYFTPPVVIHNGRAYYPYGFAPNGLNAYGQQIRGYRPFTVNQAVGGVGLKVQSPTGTLQGANKLQPVPEAGGALPKPQEIEPQPVNIQQIAAGDRDAAIRFQKEADLLFRTDNFNRAFSSYKASLEADRTRAEPYFRLATLFVSIERYEPAIRYLKQGLDYSPQFARTGDRLDDIYGDAGTNRKRAHLRRLISWAQENPGSPDRQLLAGAMLHFDDQPKTAAPYLERAGNLSQRPSRATTLLSAANAENVVPPSPQEPGLLLTPEPNTSELPEVPPSNLIPPPPALQVPPPPAATPPKAGQ
jgi:tetratricopeptide (TPR) repeat protein